MRLPLLRTVSLVVAASLFPLAGCAGDSDPDSSKESGSNKVFVVGEHGDEYSLQNGTGGLLGTVYDDSGLQVRGAAVALYPSEHTATTNPRGQFQILNIAPGEYVLRVDANGYSPTEENVTVKPNLVQTVIITVVPAENVGAGYRPHIHDYWAGRTEVPVIHKLFDWHEPYDKNRPYVGYAEVNRYYNTATQVGGVNPCIFSGEVYFNNRHIWFDDPSQLVWVGTSKIWIKLDWTSNDAPVNDLYFAYRGANATEFTVSDPIKKGTPALIDVDPLQWDSSHQAFTLWEMALCVATGNTQGRYFLGKVNVEMKLLKGHEVPPEIAHPYFWKDGTEVPVLTEAKRSYTNTQYTTNRQWSRGNWAFRPDVGTIVPPGTKELRLRIDWTYELPLNNVPWSLTYRPANVNPFVQQETGTIKKMEPAERGSNFRTYVLVLKPGESDAFYQKKSNWYFYANLEGQEDDWKYVSPCACKIDVKVSVTAVRDPTQELIE